VILSIVQALYDNPIGSVVTQMETVTISPKYQVVIPKSVRDELDLKPGQKVMAMAWDGGVQFVPVASADELHGSLPGIDTNVSREPDRL